MCDQSATFSYFFPQWSWSLSKTYPRAKRPWEKQYLHQKIHAIKKQPFFSLPWQVSWFHVLILFRCSPWILQPSLVHEDLSPSIILLKQLFTSPTAQSTWHRSSNPLHSLPVFLNPAKASCSHLQTPPFKTINSLEQGPSSCCYSVKHPSTRTASCQQQADDTMGVVWHQCVLANRFYTELEERQQTRVLQADSSQLKSVQLVLSDFYIVMPEQLIPFFTLKAPDESSLVKGGRQLSKKVSPIV